LPAPRSYRVHRSMRGCSSLTARSDESRRSRTWPSSTRSISGNPSFGMPSGQSGRGSYTASPRRSVKLGTDLSADGVRAIDPDRLTAYGAHAAHGASSSSSPCSLAAAAPSRRRSRDQRGCAMPLVAHMFLATRDITVRGDRERNRACLDDSAPNAELDLLRAAELN
jgi:hypothetical protein